MAAAQLRSLRVLPLLVLVWGCKREAPPEPRLDGACERACRRAILEGCDRDGLREADLGTCIAACRQQNRQLEGAGCDPARGSYLECLAASGLSCESARCSAAVCVEHHIGVRGCDAEYARYRSCIAPCLHAGSSAKLDRELTHAGKKRRVRLSLVRAGCGERPAPESAAPIGSPCETDSVCGQHLCVCPDGRAAYLVRACADGRCADESLACAAGLQADMAPCVNR